MRPLASSRLLSCDRSHTLERVELLSQGGTMKHRGGHLFHPKYPPAGKTYAEARADGTLRESRVWWVKYYQNGRMIRENTHTTKQSEALHVLQERLGRVRMGQPILPRTDRIQYREIANDLRQYYQTTGCRDLTEAEKRLKHLAFFEGYRVSAIGPAETMQYIARRQEEGAANGTINRELAMLGRMFRLAYENGKLLRLPVIRKLKEAAPRSGFFEREQFEAVRKRLAPDLQLAVTLAYTYGWRMQSEVLALERHQVDIDAGTIRLDPGQTKNDEGRIVYLTSELKSLLKAHLDRVKALERTLGRIIPAVFPHFTGAQLRTATTRGPVLGEKRDDFRKAWLRALKEAGVPGRLRHDFRRTAVRNLVSAGVSEKVAMTVTGHKTRSVFDRYHIVSPADLQEATRKLAAGQVQAKYGASSRKGVSEVLD